MKVSNRATSAFRDTYTVRGAAVQRTPSRSQASVKIRRMSSDTLLNEYRGWLQLRPVLMNRHLLRSVRWW